MKKSAVPAKRQARARVIELNGPAERVELLLLIFMAPLWGIIFPLIGLSVMLSNIYTGCLLMGVSFFCFLHFLHLNNNRFSFEEKGVRLPGVDHAVRSYEDLKNIYLESTTPLLLAVEFVPNKIGSTDDSQPGHPVLQLFEIQNLTEESARQLWSLFAMYLKSCSISMDVRDKLVNWRVMASKTHAPAPLLTDSQSGAGGGDQHHGLTTAREEHESQIARDLSLTIDLKPFDPLKTVGQYMVSYSDTFRNTWLSFWTIVAGVAYPVSISSIILTALKDHSLVSQATQGIAAGPITDPAVQETMNKSLSQSFQQILDLFGNHAGAIGLLLFTVFGIVKFLHYLNEPDSIFIDHLGVTTQKRTATGISPREHRSWKTLEAIRLLRPNQKSNSSRWTILFESREKDKLSIQIPFKALSTDRVRQQFIECLDTWGRNIEIDPALLQSLSPRNETSYTELWLNALTEAPQITAHTPHSVGLRLQSKDYQIESQLASGGQGVAYLARKVVEGEPGGVQVVLKETVLPIYVDEKARVRALARFEKDAKLLASLEHELIVKLEDFFVENNRAYLALEYIQGRTLKDKVEADGPLPEDEVRRLALLMADILSYLHERTPPVVHRDFTPDNLMLTEDGKIKLLDFDVAMEQSSFAQSNATIVGKQAYIPLEQFRGKPCVQSDIYALGATLTFLLTGQEPAALQSSHPREVSPNVSEELDQLISKATALELADRIASAAELRALLQGTPAPEEAAEVS
ncbi:MAG: serine/threonine protein kinase [Cyanobacteria bacterium SZAS TMP-1]|nr:serine/threonine protein kinase [Cyanobacteria bacterium SZAS TMP-1]